MQNCAPPARRFRTTDRIIAIGASTGGAEAIKVVLEGMPADCPGIVTTQHIPPVFSTSFARRMDALCAMTVCEAQDAGKNAIGAILTGMGDDGAIGLKEMREAGATTLAQDEKTSVVWGMPGEAVKQGAVDKVQPLERVSSRILELV